MKSFRTDVKMVYDEHSHSVVVLKEDSEVEVPDIQPVILGSITLYEPATIIKEYVFNFDNVNRQVIVNVPVKGIRPLFKNIGDVVIECIPLWFTSKQDFLQNELVRLLSLRENINMIDRYTVTIWITNINGNTVIDFTFQEIPINILIRILRVFIRRHNVRFNHFEGIVA